MVWRGFQMHWDEKCIPGGWKWVYWNQVNFKQICISPPNWENVSKMAGKTWLTSYRKNTERNTWMEVNSRANREFISDLSEFCLINYSLSCNCLKIVLTNTDLKFKGAGWDADCSLKLAVCELCVWGHKVLQFWWIKRHVRVTGAYAFVMRNVSVERWHV